MELHRTENDRMIPNERISLYSDTVTDLRRVSSNAKRGKGTIHFNALTSTPELFTRNFVAVNQVIIYLAVSVWYNRVQKMHKREPDFELKSSHADVTTLIQPGTPDTAEAKRERNATHRKAEFKDAPPREAGFPMTVSVGQTFVTKPSVLLEILSVTTDCREYTGTRERRTRKQANWETT